MEWSDLLIDKDLWKKLRKIIISLFVIFNFTLIYLCLERNNLLAARLLKPFWNYFLFFGLEQDYSVFAPSPIQANVNFVATITYKDGVCKLYNFQRLDRVNLVNKLTQERWRKFLDDNLGSDRYPFLYKDIAKFVARKNNDFKDNPPAAVCIYRYTAIVPPPELKRNNPGVYSIKPLIAYEVKAEDLR